MLANFFLKIIMTNLNSHPNLLGMSHAQLITFCKSLGEPAFRAQQLIQWIHQRGVTQFDDMQNLSKVFRQKLKEVACIQLPEVAFDTQAPDGTHKWVLKLADGNCIETVFIPEKTRGTLCISSQVGCVLNCDFCSTGKQGFNRNLSASEIISQVFIAVRALSYENGLHDKQVTNIVFMGMGEPLLNLDEVLSTISILLDDFAYGFSKRRVTVSTAGVVPQLYELRQATDVALAISLHAPDDALRNILVPINKKYPLKELMTACKYYFQDEPRRSITMEYVMLAGVNDQRQHAKALAKLLQGIRVKINLIPFNPFPNTIYQRSSDEAIEVFRNYLINAGFNTTVRRTRGEKIDAACGQLVGRVQDRTKRQKQYGIQLGETQSIPLNSLKEKLFVRRTSSKEHPKEK